MSRLYQPPVIESCVHLVFQSFVGLNLFGVALRDVVATLVQCEETDIAQDITKFIADLVACTECKYTIKRKFYNYIIQVMFVFQTGLCYHVILVV